MLHHHPLHIEPSIALAAVTIVTSMLAVVGAYLRIAVDRIRRNR